MVASAQHGDLVAQHHDLDVFRGVGSGEQCQPAEHAGERQVDESEGHSGRSCSACGGTWPQGWRSRSRCSEAMTRFSAPTGSRRPVRCPALRLLKAIPRRGWTSSPARGVGCVGALRRARVGARGCRCPWLRRSGGAAPVSSARGRAPGMRVGQSQRAIVPAAVRATASGVGPVAKALVRRRDTVLGTHRRARAGTPGWSGGLGSQAGVGVWAVLLGRAGAVAVGEQPRVFRTGFLSAFTLLHGFPAKRRELPAVCNIRVLSEFSWYCSAARCTGRCRHTRAAVSGRPCGARARSSMWQRKILPWRYHNISWFARPTAGPPMPLSLS